MNTEKSSLEAQNQPSCLGAVGRSTGMECLHCQKDYIDDTIIVQYEGVYNYDEMMEYVNRCYDNVKGEVIEHEKPSEWQGYKNMGSVLIR
jgi:hypothetical protein